MGSWVWIIPFFFTKNVFKTFKAASIRQHSLSSSTTTKENSHFTTSLCWSPDSEWGDRRRVVYRLSHSPDETERRLRKWGAIGNEWQSGQHFGQLELFTSSSGPTSDREQRSFSSYSSKLSKASRNLSCEVSELPIHAFQCSYRSPERLFSSLSFSHLSSGIMLSACPVVHRVVLLPEHLHASYITGSL